MNLHRSALHHFHRFLRQAKLEMDRLEEVHIQQFDEDLTQHNLKFATRRAHINHIHMFMRWLEGEEKISGGISKKLFPNYKADAIKPQYCNLPELGSKFLEVLLAVNKKNTVNGYKSCLRAFYGLHWKTKRREYNIIREDIESFMIFLKNKGMHPEQRFARLVQLRRYLDWLWEHKKLKTSPDDLITHYDFPKKEDRLPRPFPVDVDFEIQKRLEKSDNIDHLGLLLMRRCGLRAGELRNLKLDCVESDLDGHWFLKVPLGKLNNERIIPLDPKTVEIVERIKRHHSHRPDPNSEKIYMISNSSGRRRSANYLSPLLQDVVKDLAIPGKVCPHRLRHSFATSLLSAGLSITTLKTLLGHRDIRMTLMYAAVTQETVRNDFFGALSKVKTRYEVASFPLKTPDLRLGITRAFWDINKYIAKYTKEFGNADPQKLKRLLYRLNMLRHEFSTLLKTKV